MCGSAEGPTPEQLAHPPLQASELAMLRWLGSLILLERRQTQSLFDLLKRSEDFQPSERFIIWPVRRAQSEPSRN